jgi:hypothetical protein
MTSSTDFVSKPFADLFTGRSRSIPPGVADTRSTSFAAEATRQSRLIAKTERSDEWMVIEDYFLDDLAGLD